MRYPKSGLYQQYKSEIENIGEQFDKIAAKPEEAITGWFQVPQEKFDTVTDQEKEDVANFARYAGRGLASAALHAPLFAQYIALGRPGVQIALRQGVRPFYHDALHAMFAYDRTGGESLTPAYLNVSETNAQYTDPAAIQEEAMVLLWQNAQAFMERVFKGEDALALAGEIFIGDAAYEKARVQEVLPLKDVSPIEYYLGIHEAYCLNLLSIVVGNNEAQRADLKKAFEVVARNRSQEYVHVMELLYNNSQSQNPDPKVLLHEFQRILKPLLERLRGKSEREGVISEPREG